jgi:hypothetical protein
VVRYHSHVGEYPKEPRPFAGRLAGMNGYIRRHFDLIEALLAKAENYPRGALNIRRKQNKGKEYVYHYLVRRDGKKVINRHISEKELPELQNLIEEREKCRKEIRAYKKRMAYLEKLLNKPNPGGGRHESAAR